MQGGRMRRSGAVATSIDDNAADEKSDKSIWRLLNFHCTSVFHPNMKEGLCHSFLTFYLKAFLFEGTG